MMKRNCIISFFLSLLVSQTALGAEDPAWIQKAYHKSFHYEQTQNYDYALKVLQPVYKSYPNQYTINLRLGWLYYLSAKYANSIYHYNLVIKIAPVAIEPKLGLMLPQLAQERYGDAEQNAYQILNIDRYNYYANSYLIQALKKQNKTDTALAVVEKMLALYPTDVSLLVELGNLYLIQNKINKANFIFNDVLTLDPENLTAKSVLGIK